MGKQQKAKKKTLILLSMPFLLLAASCSYDSNDEVSEKTQFSYTKNDVAGFYALLKEKSKDLSPMLLEGNCYNVTTSNLGRLGIGLFKFKDECDTFLQCGEVLCYFAVGFGGYGFINAVTCDFDNNGVSDILYTYSYGSGIHRSVVAVFNMTTFAVTTLFSTMDDDWPEKDSRMADLTLEKKVEDGKSIYETCISKIGFEDGFLAVSAVKEKLAMTINLSDYASYPSTSAEITDSSLSEGSSSN